MIILLNRVVSRTPSKSQKLYSQNLWGLKTKLSNMQVTVTFNKYDVIALVKTWLGHKIRDSEVDLFGYNVYRFNRNF